RVQRDLAQQERPVVRKDLVEQPPQRRRDLEPVVDLAGGPGGQFPHVNLSPLHGRSQKARPIGTLKSDFATKMPSSTSSGSIGSRRVAGPKTGRALSMISNCDWWHGHSRRFVCCS